MSGGPEIDVDALYTRMRHLDGNRAKPLIVNRTLWLARVLLLPAGEISGTFTALTQTSDWTGCSALPCSWDWSGTVTGGGSGIDIYGVGSYEYLGNLSSNGEMLTGTYEGPTGPGVTPTDFGTWTASRVPEPATLWLFGIGLAALRLLGRRRRA